MVCRSVYLKGASTILMPCYKTAGQLAGAHTSGTNRVRVIRTWRRNGHVHGRHDPHLTPLPIIIICASVKAVR